MKLLRFAGVTGTNGKTTTTSMISEIVSASGEPSGSATTLGTFVNGQRIPECASAFERLVRAASLVAKAGGHSFNMEVTSTALGEGFAAAWPVDVAVFTNLTRDHLDQHGSAENYLACKAQLFMTVRSGGVAVLNASERASLLLHEVTPQRVERRAYAVRPVAPACRHLPIVLRAKRTHVSRAGTIVELERTDLARSLGGEINLCVHGTFHVENAFAAALAAEALGHEPRVIVSGFASFPGVPGRFEIVSSEPLVAVDYAHSPDALAKTLELARTLTAGRVICTFGCGGNRDRGKRSLMGRVAGRLADYVVFTTDNPRTEDPERIAEDVHEGARGTSARWDRVPDRAVAIERAINAAESRDVVVIAGKGHEEVQIIGTQCVPFSDADVVRRVMRGDILKRATDFSKNARPPVMPKT
jgi:UDP-N-acetylmuramoyl-L-alanyl-D-glutamate--2,6-diaminopimelate ligase